MSILYGFPEGLIEAAFLTVGDEHENIIAWIDYYKEAVERRLPENLYFDCYKCSVCFRDSETPVEDVDFEDVMHEAERETDDWWNNAE